MQYRQFTAIIEREADGFVALCPELDVASQGDSVEEARNNLVEAIELFLESASPQEIGRRLADGTITVPVPDHKEIRVGTLQAIIRQSGLPRNLFEV